MTVRHKVVLWISIMIAIMPWPPKKHESSRLSNGNSISAVGCVNNRYRRWKALRFSFSAKVFPWILFGRLAFQDSEGVKLAVVYANYAALTVSHIQVLKTLFYTRVNWSCQVHRNKNFRLYWLTYSSEQYLNKLFKDSPTGQITSHQKPR